jgi:hypothetical protein
MAVEQPFSISIGNKIPKFPSTITVIVSREKVKQTAEMIKLAKERSSTIPELYQLLENLVSQLS